LSVISKRLECIIDYINDDVVADVACDHAYISIGAVTRGRAGRAVACDINQFSVDKAVRNVARFGLDGKIEVRLADGLCGVLPCEADVVVAAGVGGRLICDILRRDIDKTKQFAKYILQPQRDVSLVRRFLHEIGFRICAEDVVYDNGQYYFVIEAVDGCDAVYTDAEYIFGKIPLENGNAVLKDYIERKLLQMSMYETNDKTVIRNSNKAIPELAEKMNIYKEALRWLS
jgi:tRNA (adenine22-N1)-methyltransferase